MDSENTVPKLDLNAELPALEIPVEDEIMTGAKKEWKIGLVVFSVFVMMLGGAVWAFQKSQIINSQISNKTIEMPKEVPVESAIPEASVKPVFAIFNGSGIAGAAAKLKAKIEAAGFEVVEVGNAETVQTGTTVEIGSTVANQKDEIMKVLGLEKGTEPAGMILAGTLKYNVKVIIGK